MTCCYIYTFYLFILMRQRAKMTISLIITIINLKKNYLRYYFNRTANTFAFFKGNRRDARMHEQDIPLRQGPDISLHIRTAWR